MRNMSANEKLKEFGAVVLMQMMIEKYAEKHKISFNEALEKFTSSKVYDALFDYDGTELWKEGPSYLLNFYEECIS